MPGYLDDAGRYIASLLRRNPMPTPAFRGRKAPISVQTLRQAYGPSALPEDAYDAAFPNGMGSAPDNQLSLPFREPSQFDAIADELSQYNPLDHVTRQAHPLDNATRRVTWVPGERPSMLNLRHQTPFNEIADSMSYGQPVDPNFLGGGELLQHVRDNHRWRAAALRSGMDDAGEYSSRLANGNMIPDAQQFRTLDARSLTDGGVRRAMQIASDEAIRRKLTAIGVGGGLIGALGGGIALDSMDDEPAEEMYSGQEDLSGMAPEDGMLPDMEMPDLGMPDINGSRPGATISARALAEMADSLDAPPDEGPSIEDLMTDYSTEDDDPLDTAMLAAEASPLPSASPRTVISPVSQQQYSQPAANNYRQLGPIRQILSNMRDRREYRQARRRSR